MKRILKILVIGLGVMVVLCTGADAAPRFNFEDNKYLEIFQMIQVWNAYTIDAKDSNGEPVDDRLDTFIRRGRIGVKGHIREDLNFKVWFAYDQLGKDRNTGTIGSPQDQSNKSFYIWDAMFTWKANPIWANATLGYFRPQVGRESITTAFAVNSFMKSLTNSYLREHIVGRSPGRETGWNIGGLYNAEGWGVNYNIGMFDTNHEKIAGTDKGGKKWAPLYALRAAFTYGAPEMKSYGIGYNINYWGKRNGTTAAINYTYQGETDVFDKNSMLGFDILSNYGDFNFNAEYDLLSRDKVNNTHYTDRVWHIRAGYNIHLANGQIIEPVVMYSGFEGDGDSTYYSKGEDRVTDIGVNWYINKKKLKLNLHYTISDGDAESKYKDTTGKERGDFIGLGIQFII